MALDVLVADVSGWQQDDVGALARDGFKAVIPKYTEDMSSGSGFRAHAQASSARAAGMSVFAGYDFGGGSDGAAQCDALLHAFAGDAIQRAVLDAEVGSVNADIVVSFGRRAREWNPAVKPILYGSTSFIQSMYAGVGEIADLYDAWIAAYTGGYQTTTHPLSSPPASPPPFGGYVGWQFTSVFPSQLGQIDASVFDIRVFETDVKTAPAQRKSGDTMVISEINDDGSIKQWWYRAGENFSKIDQGDAFVMAVGGVPWVKDVHGATLFSWMLAAAHGVHDMLGLVGNIK